MESAPECRICRTEASIGKNMSKQVILQLELSYDEIYYLLDLFLRNTQSHSVIQCLKIENHFAMFLF